MKMKGIFLLAAAALFAVGQAFATPVNVAPYGDDGPGTGLQDLFNSIIVSGPGIDVKTDQVHPSAYWQVAGSHKTSTNLIFEIAGNKNFNGFGIFDPNNYGTKLYLYHGSDSPYLKTSVTISDGGHHYHVTRTESGGNVIDQTSGDFTSVNKFGFFLDTPDGVFYSDWKLNDDGAEHMVGYEGGNGNYLKYQPDDPPKGMEWVGNEYIFGWEDLSASSWDQDYNDFVVYVESIAPAPVPEPTALAMFGLGLLGLGFGLRMSRRRRS